MKETENYLYNYLRLERLKRSTELDLDEALEEYHRQSDKLLNPVCLSFTKTRKTNKRIDSVQQAVISIIDVYQSRISHIQRTLLSINEEQQQILAAIENARLSPIEQSYIRFRYLKGHSSIQTAYHLNYSERQVMRFRVSALSKIAPHIKKEPPV